MGNIDPFDQCAGSIDDGKYPRPIRKPMTEWEDQNVEKESSYIQRFLRIWFCIMAVIAAIVLVVRGMSFVVNNASPPVSAFIVCVVVSGIIAAIAAAGI